ncbi:hypothetical protein BaRGS_00037134, partial [Batillaria attramentaria]
FIAKPQYVRSVANAGLWTGQSDPSIVPCGESKDQDIAHDTARWRSRPKALANQCFLLCVLHLTKKGY